MFQCAVLIEIFLTLTFRCWPKISCVCIFQARSLWKRWQMQVFTWYHLGEERRKEKFIRGLTGWWVTKRSLKIICFMQSKTLSTLWSSLTVEAQLNGSHMLDQYCWMQQIVWVILWNAHSLLDLFNWAVALLYFWKFGCGDIIVCLITSRQD